MDLLNENITEQQQPPKGKKIILILLILSIIAVIAVIMVMVYVGKNTTKVDDIYINGNQQFFEGNVILEDNAGNKYIAIKDFAELVGYEYYGSEYGQYGTDTSNCYVKNKNLITGFEMDSNIIFKYEEKTNLDYQTYLLKHNVLLYNNKLYVAIEDLNISLNVSCTIDSENGININTMEHLHAKYQEQLKESGYIVTTSQNNQKALAYGWIIVNKDGMNAILNTNFEEILGSKYKTIYFDEYNLEYIVSNENGQYGIITRTGQIKHTLGFDGLEVLNYENNLYKVKNNNQYGIMKSDGTFLADIIYEDIGYPADSNNKIIYTLIIPKINENKGETIVVKKYGKYGLIYLENGETYLPCDHLDKLYSIKDRGQIFYKIEAEEKTVDLLEYLIIRETQQVVLN